MQDRTSVSPQRRAGGKGRGSSATCGGRLPPFASPLLLPAHPWPLPGRLNASQPLLLCSCRGVFSIDGLAPTNIYTDDPKPPCGGQTWNASLIPAVRCNGRASFAASSGVLLCGLDWGSWLAVVQTGLWQLASRLAAQLLLAYQLCYRCCCAVCRTFKRS